MLKIIKFVGFSADILQFKIAVFKPNYQRFLFETGDDNTA
jgi:hypothetical protein